MAVGEWDRRELCPDEGCIGLIGPEGTCKVCGRVAPNWGEERMRGTKPVAPEVDDDDGDDDLEDAAGIEPDPIKPSTKVEIGGGAWRARQLCSDGACVGLIGADGKCKVCGKLASAATDDDDQHDAAAAHASAGADDDAHDDDDDEDDDDDDDGHDDDEDDDNDDDLTGDGRSDNGDDEALAAAADSLAGVATTSDLADAKGLAAAARGATRGEDEDDDDLRKLCPDGACIGVIGPDGKCKVCGKAAA